MEEPTISVCSERDSFDHGILSKLVHVKHCQHFSLVFSAPREEIYFQLRVKKSIFSSAWRNQGVVLVFLHFFHTRWNCGILKDIVIVYLCLFSWFPASGRAGGVRIIYLLISGDSISVSVLKEKKLHAIKK